MYENANHSEGQILGEVHFNSWRCLVRLTRTPCGRPALHLVSLHGEYISHATENPPVFLRDVLLDDEVAISNQELAKALVAARIVEGPHGHMQIDYNRGLEAGIYRLCHDASFEL